MLAELDELELLLEDALLTVMIEDPSGNPVELFEPTRPEARLAR